MIKTIYVYKFKLHAILLDTPNVKHQKILFGKLPSKDNHEEKSLNNSLRTHYGKSRAEVTRPAWRSIGNPNPARVLECRLEI